jgi:hypothetical protein
MNEGHAPKQRKIAESGSRFIDSFFVKEVSCADCEPDMIKIDLSDWEDKHCGEVSKLFYLDLEVVFITTAKEDFVLIQEKHPVVSMDHRLVQNGDIELLDCLSSVSEAHKHIEELCANILSGH